MFQKVHTGTGRVGVGRSASIEAQNGNAILRKQEQFFSVASNCDANPAQRRMDRLALRGSAHHCPFFPTHSSDSYF